MIGLVVNWLCTFLQWVVFISFLCLSLYRFFQHPNDLVGWVQYVVQSIFQGVALPILGYVSMKAGENQERLLNETHDTVMKELELVKEELQLAKEERAEVQKLIEELHHFHIKNN
jgi:hypothetical protein